MAGKKGTVIGHRGGEKMGDERCCDKVWYNHYFAAHRIACAHSSRTRAGMKTVFDLDRAA